MKSVWTPRERSHACSWRAAAGASAFLCGHPAIQRGCGPCAKVSRNASVAHGGGGHPHYGKSHKSHDLLPTARLVIDARARRAFRPIDVLSPGRVASALLSKVRLKEVVSCCCHVVSCCSHGARARLGQGSQAWGECSPNAKEAPAGTCFERFLNLDLDAL